MVQSGIAIILAIAGFHHGFGFLFSTHGAEHLKTNPLGVDFGGNWWAGAEETKNAARQVPRAMRQALLVGGLTSFVLVAALLLATPKDAKGSPGRSRILGWERTPGQENSGRVVGRSIGARLREGAVGVFGEQGPIGSRPLAP